MMPDSRWQIKLLFVLACCISAKGALCQTGSPISTDRPDQTDGTYTLPQHYFQLETGLTYGKASGNYLLHTTMLRYGLLPATELRVEADYGHQDGFTGILPATISLKQKFFEEKGWRPAVAAIANLGLPFLSTNNFRPDKIPAGITLAFDHTLSDKFSLAYNAGPFLNGETDRINWLATANLGFSPLDKISFFLEYFATYNRTIKPDHNLDAGLLWLLKNNLQLDLALGSSIFRRTTINRFVTTGLSYRFNR